jgi:uncharacterized protein with NRDE domain
VCTLAVYLGCFHDHPLIVAANRDEAFARPSLPPGELRGDSPRAFGGRDVTAGGTWLGINAHGLVAGVLNRQVRLPRDLTCRSRGQLCLDLLACHDADEAAARAAREPAGRYNPFNLLLADATGALVVSQAAGEAPRVEGLERGLHLLTNLDVNDPRCPRIGASHGGFAAAGDAFAADADVDALVRRLAARLADHTTALDPRGPGALCVHGDGYGTRSSTIIVRTAVGHTRWYQAEGPPCRTPFTPVALPF